MSAKKGTLTFSYCAIGKGECPLFLSPELQRIEESQQPVPLNVRQRLIPPPHLGGLTVVATDRLLLREGQAIVHQTIACAQRPQRGRANLIGGAGVFGSGQNRDA